MLFATTATLSVSIVLMRLGSFTYSTYGSHHGKSFKLFYKKNQDPPQQGLHPAEILKALKCKGLMVSFSSTTSIFRKLRLTLTGSVANLP